jgi:hypothetical protein
MHFHIVDQLRPLFPKDSEEVNLKVKRLHALLDATTLTGPRVDSANSISTTGLEHD